jgi:glycosyltransferase involved in cell wall biosynthesis
MKTMLYLSQKPAFPIVDGGSKAIASFLWNVASCKGINLIYAPICTQKHPLDVEMLRDKIPNLPIHPIEINTHFTVFDFLKNFFEKIPLNVKRYLRESTFQTLEKLDTSHAFDCVLCDGFYSVALVPEAWFQTKKIYYRAHNIEHAVWEHKSNHSHGMKRWYFAEIAKKLKRYETELLPKVEEVLAIAAEDAKYFKQHNAKTHTFYPTADIVPTGYLSSEKSLCFIGNFDWQPNVDAIDSFLQDIYPRLRTNHPELQFHIAGKGSSQFTNKTAGIYGHGFVDDANAFLVSHGIFIAPLRFGTGLNIKVMDALCLGKPAVLTEVAIQGLSNSEGLCIAKTTEHFEDLLHEVIINKTKQEALSQAALAIARIHFSKDTQIVALQNLFNV